MNGSAQLVHDALLYGTDEELVAAAVMATTRSNAAILRDAFGADAGAVRFIDRDDWYQRPAGTVAGWKGKLDEAIAGGHRRVRFVGEVRFGVGDQQQSWIRYESALNRVFSDAPAWILCPYDLRTLEPAVLDGALLTHPAVLAPVRQRSTAYQAPEQLLGTLPEPMPEVAGAPIVQLPIHENVSAVRHAVRTVAARDGWLPPERLADLLLALSEVVANSLRHGHGRRHLRLWLLEATVVCEVSDEGGGPTDPLTGYRPPRPGAEDGMGLWIAKQLCDALAWRTYTDGTVVRFTIGAGTSRTVPAGHVPVVIG